MRTIRVGSEKTSPVSTGTTSSMRCEEGLPPSRCWFGTRRTATTNAGYAEALLRAVVGPQSLCGGHASLRSNVQEWLAHPRHQPPTQLKEVGHSEVLQQRGPRLCGSAGRRSAPWKWNRRGYKHRRGPVCAEDAPAEVVENNPRGRFRGDPLSCLAKGGILVARIQIKNPAGAYQAGTCGDRAVEMPGVEPGSV